MKRESFIRALIFSIYFFMNCAHGADVMWIIERKDDEVVSVRQGYANKGGVFVPDGVRWHISEINQERSISRSMFRGGKQLGATRHFSGVIAKGVLGRIVRRLASEDISSELFAERFFRSLSEAGQ